MNKNQGAILLVATMFIAGVACADTVNISGLNYEFETIGNAGNAADSSGYGAVGYNYKIGTYEISVAQFQDSGLGSGNEAYWGSGANPVSKVSWHEAAQYCNWLTTESGNSTVAYTIVGGEVTAVMSRAAMLADGGTFYVMPTEDEWYKAAYYTGSGYSLYANGTGTAPVDGTDSLYDQSGVSGPAWSVGSGVAEQNGTFDMMGNLWEWTESAYDGDLDNVGESTAFRGGSYFQGASWLQSASRALDTPSLEHEVVGMRIVAIPEPSSIAMIGLMSGCALFIRRTFML